MRKIVYAVYHDLRWEARSREVLEALQQFAEVHIVTYADIPDVCMNDSTHVYIVKELGGIPGSRYWDFINTTRKVMKAVKPEAVLFHDFSLLIPWTRKHLPTTKIVYDQSELVIDRKVKSVKTYFLSLFDKNEKRNVNKVDVYIAANQERAEIAKNYFGISSPIIVFDNMHRIDDICDENACDLKFGLLLKKSSFPLVYGGGIREDRGTFEMADAFQRLGKYYNLVVAGNDWGNEERFLAYLKDKKIENVDFIGFVDRAEWGYLLAKSKASMVFFLQNTVNNTYCASGKMYESLFLGKPIVCSTNPPLEHLCEKYHCGVCSDDLAKAIVELRNNYASYLRGVDGFINDTDYEGRLTKLADSIQECLHSYSGE